MPNPNDDEELFNAIVIGGVRSPGIVTLSGHAREENWDVKEGDGSAGASTTHKGEKIARFTATFELWDEAGTFDHFAEWEPFVRHVRKATSTAMDVYHPDLVPLDVRSVVVAKVGGVTHDGKGGGSAAIDFLEYRPPKPKTSTPGGSQANGSVVGGVAGGEAGGTTGEVDPNADAAAELDRLVQQAQEP
jgi:hypothetical protein